MEQKGNREQVVKDNVVNTGKESVPLMVLTSGKVVANIGAQWKEIKDNRVQNKGKQSNEHVTTGNEIIIVDKDAAQQVQTANKFVVLEVEDGEINETNHLALVEESAVLKSPIHNPKKSWDIESSGYSFYS